MVDYGITRGGTVNGALTVTGGLTLTGASNVSNVFAAKVVGDAVARATLNAGGGYAFGDGTNATDTNLYRAGAGTLQTDSTLLVPDGYIELSTSPTFTLAAQTATPLALALAVNATYLLDAVPIISNATGNTAVSWTGPAGATMQWNDTTTSTDYAATIGATNTYAASASTRMAILKGKLKTTNSGTLTMTLGVSAGTTTLAAGSFLRLTRVA